MSKLVSTPPIYDGRRLPWPVDWPSVFGREAPLLVEVGFGNGRFLVALASARPEANVVGLEISQPALRRADQRIRSRALPNLRLVYGLAQQFLWSNCRPGSVDEVYINFPDPWPKAAHHHRRLIDKPFLDLLATRLRHGGRLEIATDHAEYAEVIAALLGASPYFSAHQGATSGTSASRPLRTKYERKAIAEGRTCHYFSWHRTGRAARRSLPVPEEMDMPHAILDCPLTLDEITAEFESASYTDDEHVVRFIALYQRQEPAQLLIDTHVEEEPLSQRVAVTIRPRGRTDVGEPAGEIIVGLHALGFPRATPGLHAAIYYTARWLQSLHPEMRLKHTNVRVEAAP
ncbi:MAG: tRNA (guanosine(46)-N7)-methyltransferase TrmB [Anaerolineae bacterium]|nr:tRNA (guanosine(46)-N7)-methyltransferase TrmB [Anaerolineae bacterium]